jgi:transaldolase
MDKLPDNLRDRLGIAIAGSTYVAYRDLLDSARWQRLANWGARTQRLLFASTGTKDPRAPDTLYVGALAAPNTINTIPEETLSHFADRRSRRRLASRRRSRERDAVGDRQGGRRS